MGRLGKYIQSLRRKRDITVRALADAVGKTPGYLSRVETRDEIPSPEFICSISDLLREKPEVLLDLAKLDLMQRTKEQIERKASEALSLYRRSR
jgi:transcriptional regulator with XRE-family HTH domain